MRRACVLLLLALALLVGCAAPAAEAALPRELIAMWRSADPGELDLVETIEFFEDGSFTVSCTYQGQDTGTLTGTWTAADGTVSCRITGGAAPYTVDYAYTVDGRELTLEDDDGPAHYLRVS